MLFLGRGQVYSNYGNSVCLMTFPFSITQSWKTQQEVGLTLPIGAHTPGKTNYKVMFPDKANNEPLSHKKDLLLMPLLI